MLVSCLPSVKYMDLQALYERPENAVLLRSRYFVEGAITGACASPEIPMPDVWMRWALAERSHSNNNAQSAEQTALIFDQLFEFFKARLANMKNNQLCLPAYAVFRGVDNSHELAQYCSGLMLAHQSSETLWSAAWRFMQEAKPEAAPEFAKDLKHCLLVFSTFANPASAVEQACHRGEPALASKLPKIAQSLSITLLQYVSISGKLAGFLPNQFETISQ